jgi:hypothetical protein
MVNEYPTCTLGYLLLCKVSLANASADADTLSVDVKVSIILADASGVNVNWSFLSALLSGAIGDSIS